MKRTLQLSRRLWTVVWLVAALSDCAHPIAVSLWRANARQLKADSSYDAGGAVERSRRSDSSSSGSSSDRYVPMCRDPGVPRNGRRTGNSFRVGAQLVFSCNRGYVLEGAEVLTCRYGEVDEVNWDAELPRCVAGKRKCPAKKNSLFDEHPHKAGDAVRA